MVVPLEPRAILVHVASGDRFARAGLDALLAGAGFEPCEAGEADVVVWDAEPGSILPSQRAPVLALVLDEEGAENALLSGARGALLRGADDTKIVAAVRAAAASLLVVDTDVAAVAVKPRGPRPGMERLTGREAEALSLMAEGLSNKEIAARMGISEHTAKFHVVAVMNKLGAVSRTEAVVLAARGGLLSL